MSHVVVIDATLKRAQIKVSPQKYLSDVLEEACGKLGYKPDQYTLKHNNKQVELSRAFRLSGLPNAAKLNLVQSSKSPSIVSVALQLPAEGQQASGTRLTDKFASDTPIWQVLRRFEAGAAAPGQTSKANYNFTQRATPQLSEGGSSGAGRLNYEMPAINAMGRDLSTFVDLQKTLGQLGFSSGTCLLRLNFKNTEQPLEEAMADITKYFKEVEEPQKEPVTDTHGAHGGAPGDMSSKPEVDHPVEPDTGGAKSPPLEDTEMADDPILGSAPITSAEAVAAPSTEQPPSNVPEDIGSDEPQEPPAKSPRTEPPEAGIAIFAPPSSSTPAAASSFNEADYVPTIAHAQLHQSRLEKESRNKKLLSDKELADQAQAQADALKQVQEIVVRIRFPDNSQAQQSFGQDASSTDLYELCKDLLHRPEDEDFKIRFPGAKGQETLAENSRRLIADLGWKGRVLITVVWGDNVTRRGPSLKQHHLDRAQVLKVETPRTEDQIESRVPPLGSNEGQQEKKKGVDKESRMRGLLSKLSKK